jgi:hypothetical protein
MRRLGYALLLGAGLALSVWAAAPPQPVGHPHMQVAPGAQRLHTELERVSQAAARKGQYNCCINPPCEFCAVHMAKCPCGNMLAAGKPVCRECMGGWHVGEGRVTGVKAEDVKAMSTKEAMEMMKSGMKVTPKGHGHEGHAH